VKWTNSSGAEVIGNWNPETVMYSKDFEGPATTVTNHYALIAGGNVRPFPDSVGPDLSHAAW
jgi:hypothetical protein